VRSAEVVEHAAACVEGGGGVVGGAAEADADGVGSVEEAAGDDEDVGFE